MKTVCLICQKKFSRKCYLDKHMETHKAELYKPDVRVKLKPKISNGSQLMEEQLAQQGQKFMQLIEQQNQKIIEQQNADRESIKQENQKIIEQQNADRELIKQQNQKIIELIENTKVINNNLQIVCVGQNDNYLDMLSQQWKNFDKALEYIKGCALSSLVGDCKLIEKI